MSAVLYQVWCLRSCDGKGSTSVAEENPTRSYALREKRYKVRTEKERLVNLQELEEREQHFRGVWLRRMQGVGEDVRSG
jgi:hypothetical protein